VIVKGGSRGLGLAIVRRLICEGYCAIAVARKMNDLASAIEQVERSQEHHGVAPFPPFDLADVQEIPRLVKRCGGSQPIYGSSTTPPSARRGAGDHAQLADRTADSPEHAVADRAHHTWSAMMADGGGRVVNVASIVGFTDTAASRFTARRKRP
jgi:NAD(P)-dependent dehydrogenase (short-subunit alcohol dehydrogenase family)